MLPPLPPDQVARAIRKAVQCLTSLPHVRRVWLFGAAAKGRSLDWRSDLDFAIQGLPAVEHAGAWARLDECIDMPVDLVRWEEASPALRNEIERFGQVLFEAPEERGGGEGREGKTEVGSWKPGEGELGVRSLEIEGGG